MNRIVIDDLIFDIGCNNGDDSDFYLRKGFRVVAIDASKQLCDQVASRFASEITAGQLEVIWGAVAERGGETAQFHICNDRSGWNTADPYFVERNKKVGSTYRTVTVPTVNVADLMDPRGVPYYLKIDIEGADDIPLRNLLGRGTPPRYVSIEIAHHDLSLGMEQIHLMKELGYTQFNFFNQGMRRSVKAPNPPREGKYADYYPHAVTTGLFGEELGGRWLSAPDAEKRLVEIFKRHVLFRDHRLYSKDGKFGGTVLSKIHNRLRRHLLGDPVAWYDLHARIGEPDRSGT
jgi:FkbM family methyltransferase